MPGLGFVSSSSKKSSLISCIFVVLSHFALAMVPLFFPSSSILSMLAISALVLVAVSAFGRCCRWVLHVSTSAPALVFFNILFIWGVYIAVIREGIPSLKDAVITLEFVLLMIGLYSWFWMYKSLLQREGVQHSLQGCILWSDPGIVKYNYSCLDRPNQSSVSNPNDEGEELLTSNVSLELPAIENAPLLGRVRYCDNCKAYIRGFDHHCPAFGNCIGQKNHLLFMVILIGFIVVEASYIACASQTMMRSWYTQKVGLESNLSTGFVISTMLFSILQLLWQVLFLIWHIYCICSNMKTDEWINWKKYPEFQIIDQSQPGQDFPVASFENPYDKGVMGNIKEFLQLKIEQCSKGISKLVVAPPELNDGNSIRPSRVGPVLHLKRTWLLNKGSAREYLRDYELLAGTLTTVLC
ncbi:hypothetical protein AAC387_Pa09g1668 [Persea americana]